MYALLLSNYRYSNNIQNCKFQWLKNVKNILFDCGLINVWETHEFPNKKWLKCTVHQKVSDLFVNEWFSSIENSSNCQNSRLFKHNFEFENYLIYTPPKYLKYIVKFRTRNHRLPIEVGNWNRVPLNLRICPMCNQGIGDELHYLLECSSLLYKRKRLINGRFFRRPNIMYYEQLMNVKTSNITEYRTFCEFIKEIICLF